MSKEKDAVDRMIAVHQQALAELTSRRAELESRPEEPDYGATVIFSKVFREGGPSYDYSARRSSRGWHITGRETKTYRWQHLLDFVYDSVEDPDLRLVTKTKSL